jgi:hypothetical protein
MRLEKIIAVLLRLQLGEPFALLAEFINRLAAGCLLTHKDRNGTVEW